MVTLPLSDEIRERYLEVRSVETDRVITVLEILSPANKQAGEGREQYLRKRRRTLNTHTHLVEIDLLRGGKPMPVYDHDQETHYRILISHAEQRPQATLLL